MLWHAMPPELNTARLMAGAGPAPMLQAAAGWEAVAAALETQAAGRNDVMWLIEELRVAQLAPGAHVRPGATVKRVREALAVS